MFLNRPHFFLSIHPAWVLAALVLCLSGCGSSEPTAVSGTVTLNNEVIEEGTIRFESAGGAAAEGPIVGGKYTVPVMAGSKVVRIEGSTKVGEKEHRVPAKFNTQSELTKKIARKKTSTVDFDLKDH